MVPADRTVTVAIGHGKKAARNIDAWLRSEHHQPAHRHELAEFGTINTWYYADAPATVRPQLDAARRTSTFEAGLCPAAPSQVKTTASAV